MNARLWLLPAALLLTDPLFSQSYVLDDGSLETRGVYTPGTLPKEVALLQAYEVTGGGTDLIRNLSVICGSASGPSLDGSPLQIAVWDDPNGDALPNDAVLLGSYGGHVVRDSDHELFISYEFPQPILVTDHFFLGVVVDTSAVESFQFPTDSTTGPDFRSFRGSNASLPFDLVNLSANDTPPTASFIFGYHMLRGNEGIYGEPFGAEACSPAGLNSLNQRAALLANGNDQSGSGPYQVRLTARSLPLGTASLFLASTTQGSPVSPPGSQGSHCLGGQILRINGSLGATSRGQLFSSYFGQSAWDVDPTNIDGVGTSGQALDTIVAGQSWTFQCWYRDTNPMPTSNFTNSVTIPFQ